MIQLSLPLSKPEQNYMTLVDYLSQVWQDRCEGFPRRAQDRFSICIASIE